MATVGGSLAFGSPLIFDRPDLSPLPPLYSLQASNISADEQPGDLGKLVFPVGE